MLAKKLKVHNVLEEFLKVKEDLQSKVLNLYQVKYHLMLVELQKRELTKLELIFMLNVLTKLIKLKSKLKKVKNH